VSTAEEYFSASLYISAAMLHRSISLSSHFVPGTELYSEDRFCFLLSNEHGIYDLSSASPTLRFILHFTPTYSNIMPNSCIICSAVESPELQLQYCAGCQSASYCSKACQREDWKNQQHKKICKLLNVGHGTMQVRTDEHTSRSIELKKKFEGDELYLHEDGKQFFKLFKESTTFKGSRAVALEMKKYTKQETEETQKYFVFHSLDVLIRSDKKKLSWPNSPLLVLLEFVDPDLLSGEYGAPLREGETRETPLRYLADLADLFDYSTHEKQLILAKQLVEHGASVNAVSIPDGDTALHRACNARNVTNLDFIEYLLEAGADPNAQTCQGLTPLMHTTPYSPGAAKFLLNWPATDANITIPSEPSFLARVRLTISLFSDHIALPNNADQVQLEFQLQQWRVIEVMLVERGAHDTWITAVNQGNGSDPNARSSDTEDNARSSDMKNGVIFGGLAIFFALFIGGYGMSSTIRS
jgi:hypothetical protein